MKQNLYKTLFTTIFLLSFLYSQEAISFNEKEIVLNQKEIDNNASYTLSIGVSPLMLAHIIAGGVLSIFNGEDNSDIDYMGINFNYKFHTNKRLGYGLYSSYHQITETSHIETVPGIEDIISKKISRYYIAGPMAYFNWRKNKNIMDISTNLGICFIYANKDGSRYDGKIVVGPQIDLIDLQLGNVHSLNIKLGVGVQYFFAIGYTHKF